MKKSTKEQNDHAKTISVTKYDLTRRNMKIPMKDQQDMITQKKYDDTDKRTIRQDLTRRNMKTTRKGQHEHKDTKTTTLQHSENIKIKKSQKTTILKT